MQILTLNCQKGYQPNFKYFLNKILIGKKYDFILLQEANQKVIDVITESNASYSIINPFDYNLGENTHVCILYRKKLNLINSNFLSFAKQSSKMIPRGWGFLSGSFFMENKTVIIGSIHLHPGISTRIRYEELQLIKDQLLKEGTNNIIIIGGDFNTGFAKEISKTQHILSPEFIRITKDIGSTLNSRFTENAPFILNKISRLLAKVGLGIKLSTDHLYVNTQLVKEYHIFMKVLPERVSDHLAVEASFISLKRFAEI